MRTVILGAGAAGIQLARRLSEEGRDVVLIERDPDVARVAANALDCLVVQGDGSLPETLGRAGMGSCRHFVALTGSDELNIVTCSIVAAEFPETRRIARVRNPWFSRLDPSRRTFMGVDRFVNPDIETAKAFITMVSQGVDEGMVRFAAEDLILRSTRLQASSPFAGRCLRESRAAMARSFLVAALERDGKAEVPSGDTVPEAGDVIYLLGPPRDLVAILGEAPEHPGSRFRKIVIAGGGSIGRHVAEGFLGTAEGGGHGAFKGIERILGRKGRCNLVIVERSMELCKQLSRDLPDALVINRELGDEDLFLEEGLAGADLFIAVTPDQELNLLAAARARLFGAERCLALSENNAYIPLAAQLGLDGVISVKSNVVTSIIEYLRGGALTTLHSFYERGLKILEFTVGEGSPLHDVALRDLKLPRGSLVIWANRRGRSSLPDGDTRLARGDRLGIFTSVDSIRAVEELFLGSGA